MSSTAGTKRVFRIFWAWEDERQEKWFEAMARGGWHLKRPGALWFRFEQGPPAEVAYRIDYPGSRTVGKGDRQEYLALFRDSGWEFVGESAGWYTFRKPIGEGPAPEIFTDSESRIAKYKRILAFLGLIALILCVTQPLPLSRMLHGDRPVDLVYQAAFFVKLLCSGFLLYAAIRIGWHIRKMRRAGISAPEVPEAPAP
jgi:hypothetical protein